jgi:nitroreductase
MDIATTLRTTAAVRAFTDEAVTDGVVHDLLDDARFAPSGGNRQPWRVAVVKDPAIRRRIGELMQPVWDGYVARGPRGDAVQLPRRS